METRHIGNSSDAKIATVPKTSKQNGMMELRVHLDKIEVVKNQIDCDNPNRNVALEDLVFL